MIVLFVSFELVLSCRIGTVVPPADSGVLPAIDTVFRVPPARQ